MHTYRIVARWIGSAIAKFQFRIFEIFAKGFLFVCVFAKSYDSIHTIHGSTRKFKIAMVAHVRLSRDLAL